MMTLDARNVVLGIGLCVSAALLVAAVSPGLFGVDRARYGDVTLGLGLVAVGLCLPGAMLVSKAGRETARRYYGGPVVLVVLLLALVVAGGLYAAYGPAGLRGFLRF